MFGPGDLAIYLGIATVILSLVAWVVLRPKGGEPTP
jgi:hypothetical protein